MSYDNSNEGAIWKNDDKKSDKHPDFKGSAIIEGVEYWVSAWKRSPDGNPKAPALKFKVTAKEEVQKNGVQEAKQAVQPAQEQDSFDDDIPF